MNQSKHGATDEQLSVCLQHLRTLSIIRTCTPSPPGYMEHYVSCINHWMSDVRWSFWQCLLVVVSSVFDILSAQNVVKQAVFKHLDVIYQAVCLLLGRLNISRMLWWWILSTAVFTPCVIIICLRWQAVNTCDGALPPAPSQYPRLASSNS